MGGWRRGGGNVNLTLLDLLAGLVGHVVDLPLRLQVEHDVAQLLLELADGQVLVLGHLVRLALLVLQLGLQLRLVGAQVAVHLLLLAQLLRQLGEARVQMGAPEKRGTERKERKAEE